MNNENGQKESQEGNIIMNLAFNKAVETFLNDAMFLAESADIVDEIYTKHKSSLNLKGREETAEVVVACAKSIITHLDELRKKYQK